MSSFKIKDGKVSFSSTRKLTRKQLMTLESMGERSRDAYLSNLLGITKGRVHVPRLTAMGYDALETKKPGQVLNQFKQLLDTHADHRPSRTFSTFGQWVGVEIECIIDGLDEDEMEHGDCHYCEGVGSILTDSTDDDGLVFQETEDCDRCHGSGRAPLSARTVQASLRGAFAKAKIPRVSVKNDGSLHDDHGGVGVEITLLYNPAVDGHKRLEQVCEVLRLHKARVNKTCGLHVHLDMRHVTTAPKIKAIGKRLGNALPILSKMQPLSRRNNRFCQMSVSRLRGDRYHAVNMTAVNKFRTIEVRLHAGTVLASKIAPWIDLLKTISTSEAMNGRACNTFQALIDRANLPDVLVAHVESRLSIHAPEMLNAENYSARQLETLAVNHAETLEVA